MNTSSLNNSIDKRSAHIFRDMEGHLRDDTPTNRQMLINTVLNSDNYNGTDKWGNDWYSETCTVDVL